MTQLAGLILSLLTVYEGRQTVYAAHLRHHELGAVERAEQLAGQLVEASRVAGVDLALLTALADHESAFDHGAESIEDALGMLQLNPRSRWGRAWLDECRSGDLTGSRCEALNVLWGAYALRDALEACGGDEVLAVGFYRAGRCVDGPRGRRTVRHAAWVRGELAHEVRAEGRAGRLGRLLGRCDAAVEVVRGQAEHGLYPPLRGRAEVEAMLPAVDGGKLTAGSAGKFGPGDFALRHELGEEFAWCFRHAGGLTSLRAQPVAGPMCRAVRNAAGCDG